MTTLWCHRCLWPRQGKLSCEPAFVCHHRMFQCVFVTMSNTSMCHVCWLFLINVACRIVSYMSRSVFQQAIEPNCVCAVWIKNAHKTHTHTHTLNVTWTANPHCFTLFLRITECVSLRSHSCHPLGSTVLLTMCRRWWWNCGGRVQQPVVHKLLLHLTLHSFLPL